jgi:hypothetical protein
VTQRSHAVETEGQAVAAELRVVGLSGGGTDSVVDTVEARPKSNWRRSSGVSLTETTVPWECLRLLFEKKQKKGERG